MDLSFKAKIKAGNLLKILASIILLKRNVLHESN